MELFPTWHMVCYDFHFIRFDSLQPNGISKNKKNRYQRLNIRKCWFKMINSHLSFAICSTFGYFIFCLHILQALITLDFFYLDIINTIATHQSVIYLVFVCNINETMSASHLCSLFVSFARFWIDDFLPLSCTICWPNESNT